MPKPQDNFSFNSISQPTHTWESEDRLCLRLRGSLYSFDSISRRPIALTALLLFLCPPTPFFFSFPNHKSVSFVSAALEDVHSGDNSAAPLLPLARSEKQERKCSFGLHCGRESLPNSPQKAVQEASGLQVPGVRAASA